MPRRVERKTRLSKSCGRRFCSRPAPTAKTPWKRGTSKGKKVRVYKYKAKKGYHKRQGHRQPYTKVEIGKISV